MLLKDIETEVYELRKGAALLDKIGDFAPAWGMIGTLIGLIIMLQLTRYIANWYRNGSCDVNDIYGSVLANMIAIPLAEKYIVVLKIYIQRRSL